VLIATKFGMKMGEGKEGGKPAYVLQAAEDSLKRLGTDYIDLYQIHRADPSTPIADTLGALTELVKAGKVREIGCSNFSAQQLREAAQVKGVSHFVSVQNNYSLLHREPEGDVLPECQRLGIAFLPYFPLANGLLTGKYRKGQPFPKASRAEDGFGPKIFTEENLAVVDELRSFAEYRRHTLLELAMGWLASKAVVASIIAGAKTPEQVKANASALTWRLSVDEVAEVNDILAGARTSQ
jgi:aryl-alcohol dehydrogenase-like predicted oxidoreductase